jgi:metal-dependent HD superfamily phosphatase/phosphodiesterase
VVEKFSFCDHCHSRILESSALALRILRLRLAIMPGLQEGGKLRRAQSKVPVLLNLGVHVRETRASL